MTSLSRYLALALLTTAALGCGRGDRQESPEQAAGTWTLSVQPLASPAGKESLAPQLTGSPKGAILSWLDREGDGYALRYAERTAAGWTPPATVARGSDWFVSWADVPTVLRMSDGTLVSNWFVTTREQIEAYDLYLSYSKDNGASWAPPFTPHRDGTETQHGFATLFEMPDRSLGLVWLDGRDMENNTTHPEGGVMMLRFTSFDPSWKQGADVVVNEQVCECCQTAAVVTPDGVVALFRDRSDAEIRDIAVARREPSGTWTTTGVVHADNWEIFGCPVNGPALSGNGSTLAAAWFTMRDDQGFAYAAFSSDAGRSWSEPIRLNERESMGYVDIELLDDGSAVASWVEFVDGRRHLRARRVESSGAASAPAEVAGSGEGRLTGYPRMVRNGDELLFAWSESAEAEVRGPEGQNVKGAVARLPRTTTP